MVYKYILKVLPQGQYPTIVIDERRFLELKSSNEILTEALAIEEKYELIIRSFLDLEKELINLSVTSMVKINHEYYEFFEERLKLNLRMMTLLTTVRLYIDSINSHVVGCVPGKTLIKDRVKKFFNIEYDKNVEYQFMEALRNFVTHRNTPVHLISTRLKWITKEDRKLEHSAYIFSKKEFLNKSFKKKVLNLIPEEIDLLAYTRVYIESISLIQCQVRELISEKIVEARSSLELAINEYKKKFKEQSYPLHAYKFEDDKIIDEVLFYLEWDNVRIRLEKYNPMLKNLSKSYVTGQAQMPS